MSEFDNEFIMQQAKERKLNIYIGERQNLKNRRTESQIIRLQNRCLTIATNGLGIGDVWALEYRSLITHKSRLELLRLIISSSAHI